MQNDFNKEDIQKVLFKDDNGQIFESFSKSWNLKNTKGVINETALHQK